MKSIAQFKISKEDDTYIAEGIDLAIVTEAPNFEDLMKNIKEAVALHLEGEDLAAFEFARTPSILVNFEIPQYA